jgi:hypothetical protein
MSWLCPLRLNFNHRSLSQLNLIRIEEKNNLKLIGGFNLGYIVWSQK